MRLAASDKNTSMPTPIGARCGCRACTNLARSTPTSPTRRSSSSPTGADAAAFYTKSIDSWRACAPASYTYGSAGQEDVTWDVGQVEDNGAMLLAPTSQQGAAWLCQRALTAAAAIVVDILTCSNDPTDALAAQRIAHEIAGRVAGQ